MKINLLLILVLTFCQPLAAQVDSVTSQTNMPAHPRILLYNGEEEAVKKTINSDKTWLKIHDGILAECDRLLGVAPVERKQIGRRLLSTSREALRRVFFLSYAWRMTRDNKYVQRAEKEMLAVSAFSDWNPSHFLDVGEMTMAVAIGYDWLYHNLSQDTRTAVKTAILKKGLEPSLDPKYNSWLRATHNWNQVCNAGMTYGAMAIYEDHPDFARTIINRAIRSIELPMKDYSPDGAYPEGYGYWGYGTSFNVMFLSAIEKLFGKDFGLSSIPGFLQTAGYLENMTGPSGNSFNYSDVGSGGSLQPPMFWFAGRLKDPQLLWVERGRLMDNDAGKFVSNRLLPAIILWSNGVNLNAITEPKSTMWVGKGSSPVALMRTSWSDPAAIYVGLKAGAANVNHAHMDIGSFIMEADGVRWAMDFGSQEYESLESKGIKLFGREQDAERWKIFRYNNLTHNTLTFNNAYQKVDGYAPISAYSNNAMYMHAITDLSAVYKGSVAKAVRGVALINRQYVAVRDEIETLPQETTVRWTLLTPATVKIIGKNMAELTKDGKKLTLQVQEPANITMRTWSTEPTTDYDAKNPGTTLVGFEMKIPSGAKTALTVLLVPEKAKSKANQKIQPLVKWPQGAMTKR